nr:autotransporter outer membrane beta-barrel domain-containing protein [Marinicella sp. W31]MDC2877795.1 autotransporter domain-containing protein [Marinicella sp. W31]
MPGTTATGGLLYNTSSGAWSAMPVATENGVNYPNAIGSSPYGPSFGNQGGVLRTVGSYITEASTPYDLSYLYDAAAAPGKQITELVYPSAAGNPTLYTIAHSTFGDTLVGNYDTRLATGNAMIYTISTGAYVTNNKPGAVSTTAYGVYGDMIAGGYADVGIGGGIGFEHGYLYNTVTDNWTTYDHPGAIITHLEGITSAGRSGEYNMVANWVTPDGALHAGILHVNALGIPSWYELNIPGANVVSSNSAYGDTVVGIYLMPGDTAPNGYVATVSGIYNPIRNTGSLSSAVDGDAALSGRKGDDIINDGAISMTGNGGIGMRGETYGVLTNNGTVTATGLAGAAVELHGVYGTFLNYGNLSAPAVADALRVGPDSFGTVIVNTGIIDGRIAATAGPAKRFENSGWIGVSGNGVPVTHLLSGIYSQTEAGTLSLRVGEDGNDKFGLTGTARLGGTLEVPFQTSTLVNSYDLFAATEEITGTFSTLTTPGLPGYVATALDYTDNSVTLDLTSQMAAQTGLTANQSAVGGAVDTAFNNGTLATAGNATADALNSIYSLPGSQLAAALGSLSGEIYASQQSVLINEGQFTRQAVLDRLRALNYGNATGPLATLGNGGDANPGSLATNYSSAPADAANGIELFDDSGSGFAVWGTGYGSWGSYDSDGNASNFDTSLGGIVTGIDAKFGPNSYAGVALGYSHSNSTIDGVNSSADTDSGVIAAYAGTSFDGVNVRGGVSYTFSDVNTSRGIQLPGLVTGTDGQFNAGLTQVFGEVGYGMAIEDLALEPFAGLAWAHLNTNGFTESGTAGLTGDSSNSNVGYGTLGIRIAQDFAMQNGAVFTPRASLAWQYAFGDLTPSTAMSFAAIGGSSFTASGVPLSKNSALVDIGADFKISDLADSRHFLCRPVRQRFTTE